MHTFESTILDGQSATLEAMSVSKTTYIANSDGVLAWW